jgi:hypothetical protein
MGRIQDTSSPRPSASPFPPRVCLCSECGRTYQPRRWNQRFCQDPRCLTRVRRWQANKRQQRPRERPEFRAKRAEAERARRARQREQRQAAAVAPSQGPAAVMEAGQASDGDQRSCTATSQASEHVTDAGRARGDNPLPGGCSGSGTPRSGAWSRRRKTGEVFCDRPGCYEPCRASCGGTARYCSDACAQAMRRVQERERKWKCRNKDRRASCLEYQRHWARKRAHGKTDARPSSPPGTSREPAPRGVRGSSSRGPSRLPCDPKEVTHHDRKANSGFRSRAPPSA